MKYFFDVNELYRLGEERHLDYIQNDPFPHIAFDNFVSESTIDILNSYFPKCDSDYWVKKDKPMSRKSDSRKPDKEVELPDEVLAFIWQLNSAPFLMFLSKLTGIDGLVSDPYLEGGGVHNIEKGGFLKVHADFNIHPITRLDRRINLLLYLNKDWQDSYGGHLELWDGEMKACKKRFLPVAGRCVIFSTTDHSFHGHPDPVCSPEGTSRKSIALYYYSRGRPEEERSPEHSTIYRSRPWENF